ncbi:MAG: diaminopimelate epimerase [Pelistega sp.]|nr:diaminopimelate epimerase [Pelistega sp.]
MIWQFSKMQGAGNDFIVLDGVRQAIDMTPERARALAHRQFGIGADQILLVENPSHPMADFRYRIFNADGSEVEHCGNGARCFVRFVHEQRLSGRNPLKAEIATGLITLTEQEDQSVTVDMGQTRFAPEDLAFDVSGLSSYPCAEDTIWQLPLAPQASGSLSAEQDACVVDISLVQISNPHAVQVVDDVKTAPVALFGPLIESHPRFHQRVNAGFMQVINPQEIALRVYERGAGETLACGTGACAAVVAGIRRGLLQSPVLVHTHGGDLQIAYNGEQLQMTGPATTVFQGQIDIDALVQSIPTQVLKNE